MAGAKIPDPFALWREAVNRLEAGANALANRKVTSSQRLAKSLTLGATTAMGLQRVLERALAAALARLEIPSRSEVAALAVSLQRVEDKLDLLRGVQAGPHSAKPRPARTRKPPAAAAPAASAAAPAQPSRKRPAAPPAKRPATRKPREAAR
jgi:hypothetical protein